MKEEQKIRDYRKLNRIHSFSLHKKIKARYFKTITMLRIRNLQNSISSRGKKLNLKIDSSIHRLAVKWLESKSSRLISPSFLPQRSPKSLSFTLDVRHWPLLDAWPTRTGITFIHDFSLDFPAGFTVAPWHGVIASMRHIFANRSGKDSIPMWTPPSTLCRDFCFVGKNFRRCNFSNPSVLLG